MDFVHDTLADGRPFRVLTVVDNWSRQSPVLEVGFRMSGSTVGRDRGPLRWIMARNSNRERWKIGRINGASSWILFGQANRWKTPSLNPLTDDCETSV